jgi:hypothetical protein
MALVGDDWCGLRRLVGSARFVEVAVKRFRFFKIKLEYYRCG